MIGCNHFRTVQFSQPYSTVYLSTFTLSIGQKKKLCLKKADNPFISNIELAKYYNIKPNTISDILKRKSEYLSIFSFE